MSFKTLYTTEDIKNNFPDKYYSRGSTYAKQGYVKNLSLRGDKLFANVEGSNYELYQVEIEIITRKDSVKIFEGICSCPIGHNCKHVVATLLKGEELFLEAPNNDSFVLDRNLNLWLENLKQSEKKEPTLDRDSGNILIYNIQPSQNHGSFIVAPITAYVKKVGLFGNKKSYSLDKVLSYNRADYVLDSDIVILRLISALTSSPKYSSIFEISGGEEALFLLKLLVESERCYLINEDMPKNFLRFGEKRDAKLIWKTQSDGTQALNITVENISAHIILHLTPLYYICPVSRKIGIAAIKLGIASNYIATLLKAPNIKPQQVEVFNEKLTAILGNSAHELLPSNLPISNFDIEPIPTLKLMGIMIQPQKSNGRLIRNTGTPVNVAAVGVSFNYGGKIIAYGDPNLEFSCFKKGEVQIIARKTLIEKGIMEYLCLLGFGIKYKNITDYYSIKKDYHDYITMGEKKENFHKDKILAQAWKEFVTQDIPRLKKQGWQIKMLPSFPYNIVYTDEEWYGELQDNDNQWFSVELGVNIEGNKYNLIPILLKLLKKDKHIYDNLTNNSNTKPFIISLPDGKQLALSPERIKILLGTIQYLFSFKNNIDENSELKMQLSEAALLIEMKDALQALNIRWFGGDKIQKLGKKLKDFKSITPVTIPENFQGKLRNYQHEGLNWLQFLREYQLAGILADDMGLGKTIQILAHIATEKARGAESNPFLVIAPTSLVSNWCQEAEKFVSDLKVLTLHGAKRKVHFSDISKYDLILTTYPLLLHDKDILLAYEYHTIILDEAQTIKNSNAKITHIVNQIKATHRICLTGTPLENHLGELWSLFNFLLPGYLGTSKQFTSLFRNPIEKDSNNQRLKLLTERIKPFILRRTKQEVVKELPPKTEIIRTIELEGVQRDLYETIRVSMYERVQKEIAQHGMEKSHIIVLDALLKLRQVCCDPGLLKMDAVKNITESAKRFELMNMLTEMLEEGRRILLFSQFTSMLQIIEEQLNLQRISYVKLTGQTKDRETPINSFQKGLVPLFLISLKAGGTGLNLTAADTIIHYDPWWNPAVENQATDRAYRIGQDKPVFVYKIITAGTVEEKIIAMQKKKAELMNNLFNPTAKMSSKLTIDDISILFTPLPSSPSSR